MNLTETETRNFNGRPDGLGNRLEQIIILEANSLQNNIKYNYYWPPGNKSGRSYPILFTSPNVSCQSLKKHIKTKAATRDKKLNTSSNTVYLDVAKTIKPTFDIKFDIDSSLVIGVHIRSTDRIGGNNKDQMSNKLFQQCFQKTITEINKLNPKYIYICTDNPSNLSKFTTKLNDSIAIASVTCSTNNAVYRDFFALTLCSKIYMCSKFSSFAVCASLIGGVPLVSYFKPTQSSLHRYKTIVELLPLRSKSLSKNGSAHS